MSWSRAYDYPRSYDYRGWPRSYQYYDNHARAYGYQERLHVKIKHGGGYTDQKVFDDIQRDINYYHPTARIEEAEGRRGSFEISINGHNVYSKLREGAYPNQDHVLEAVEDFSKGRHSFRRIDPVRGSSSCNIL